jgi:hypothetical protein
VLAAAVVGGMWFFTLRQLAIAASRSRRFIPLLRAVLMQVAAPTPHAAGRLLAVGTDVANLLAVEILGEGELGFVCLYIDENVAEAGEFEYFLGFSGPWQGDKEQGQGNGFRTFRRQTSG